MNNKTKRDKGVNLRKSFNSPVNNQYYSLQNSALNTAKSNKLREISNKENVLLRKYKINISTRNSEDAGQWRDMKNDCVRDTYRRTLQRIIMRVY